jgi:hypothetical protein
VGALDGTAAVAVLNHVNAVASYTIPTSPLKVRLMTANGSATSNGTEASGGSYASQSATFTTASGTTSSASNNATISFASMPACTVVGVEVWDSAGTPKRIWWGALTASKTVNSGDTFQIATGALVTSFS